MIRPNGMVTEEQARRLLRRFRDLNLGPCGIDVAQGERVVVSGCLSIDQPVERGVRYCLQNRDGEERVLGIAWHEGQLHLHLSRDRSPDSPIVEQIEVELDWDDSGRIFAPELGARLNLEDSDAREIEHFLRRIVRAVHAQEG